MLSLLLLFLFFFVGLFVFVGVFFVVCLIVVLVLCLLFLSKDISGLIGLVGYRLSIRWWLYLFMGLRVNICGLILVLSLIIRCIMFG